MTRKKKRGEKKCGKDKEYVHAYIFVILKEVENLCSAWDNRSSTPNLKVYLSKAMFGENEISFNIVDSKLRMSMNLFAKN